MGRVGFYAEIRKRPTESHTTKKVYRTSRSATGRRTTLQVVAVFARSAQPWAFAAREERA
jgi:hypothetical protein